MEDVCLQKARTTEETVLSLSKSDAWIKMKTQDGVDIYYQPSPHFNGCMYRYTCEIDAPCDVVYSVLKPPPTREERLTWDKSIADYTRVETFNDNLFVAVIITPSVMMGLISQREFLDVFSFKTISNGIEEHNWVFATSVKHDKRAETKNFVRAHTHPSGYSATKIGSNLTRVDFIINIDCGGMLPRSLVETAMPSQQIKYISSLKKEAKRRAKE